MLCVLPGGLVEAGVVHGEVELRGLSGREEETLAAADGESASLVTAILSRCVQRIGDVEDVDAAVVRRLLVADRQYLLLRLREDTFGDQVRGSVRCPWPDCGRRVTVSFSTRDVPVTPSSDKGPVYTLTLSTEAMPGASNDERALEFRLPNGADQELLSPLLAENEAAALSALLERCLLRIGAGGETGKDAVAALSPVARQEIERAMQEVTPHVDLTMDAECAECGREFSAPFDPQSFFFGQLRVSSDMLYREVHQLAFHYHWSEREIMEMPRDQRSRYLTVLAEEIARLNESA